MLIKYEGQTCRSKFRVKTKNVLSFICGCTLYDFMYFWLFVKFFVL